MVNTRLTTAILAHAVFAVCLMTVAWSVGAEAEGGGKNVPFTEDTPSKERHLSSALTGDPELRAKALRALARHHEKQLTQQDIDRLAPLLRHDDIEVRLEAARTLVDGHNLGDKHLVEAVTNLPMDKALCAATGFLYGRVNRDRKRDAAIAIPVFEKGLFDTSLDDSLRVAVAKRLADNHEYWMAPIYVKMLDADLAWVRREGTRLAPHTDEVFQKLAKLIRDESRDVRWAVAFKLYRQMEFPEIRKHTVPILRSALADETNDNSVLEMAVIGLHQAKDVESLPRLVKILRGKEEAPKRLWGASLLAGRAVAAITGEKYDFAGPRTECRGHGSGMRVRVYVDNPKETAQKHLREWKRLLAWWDSVGRKQYLHGKKE